MVFASFTLYCDIISAAMVKRKSSAAAGGLIKRRKTTSVTQDVKKIKKILSEGQEWKHVSTELFSSATALDRTTPWAVCCNQIAEGTGPQERNGRKAFLQKGVCSFQLHWTSSATQHFHGVRVMVICQLRGGTEGTASTPYDSSRGEVILNQLLTGQNSTYDFSNTFPHITELTALKSDGDGERNKYLILHDKIYKPPVVTQYWDAPGATPVGHGGYINKKITWSLKNHEMMFNEATAVRPLYRQVWVIMYTDEASAGVIQVRADLRQTFTESKLD